MHGSHPTRILLALVMVTLAAGCARATPTPEPAAIRFACLEYDAAYYEPLAEAFHSSNPNITVEILPRRYDALQSIDPADADVFAALTPLRAESERGDILSLDAWLEADSSLDQADFYPATLGLYTRNGKVWAIPSGVDLAVIFYNRDIFDERLVPHPQPGWTWDDFLTDAINLSDPSIGLYGYGAGASVEDPLFFAIQHGAHLLDDWQNPTRVLLDEPATIEAVQWYGDLIYRYGVSPSPEDARRAFGNGEYAIYAGVVGQRVAMWSGMYSSRGGQGWGREWEFDWGVATLPRDVTAATVVSVEGLAISAQTDHPQACWQWVSFLSRQVPSRLAPVRRSLATSTAFERQAGSDVAAAVRTSLENAVLIPPDMPEIMAEFGPLWTQAIDQVLNGEATAEEALTRAQAEINQ